MELKNLICEILNFFKFGIIFWDIIIFLSNIDGLYYIIDILIEKCLEFKLDYVVGIEFRGFIFGMFLVY